MGVMMVASGAMTGLDSEAIGQEANYDESQVPEYTLPDPLIMSDGRQVTDGGMWSERRGEVLRMFAEQMYGQTPAGEFDVAYRVLSDVAEALGGTAHRREIAITISRGGRSITMTCLVYVPRGVDGPVPAFVGLNFNGNHTVTGESDVLLPTSWVRNDREMGIENNRAQESSRGSAQSRWPIRAIMARGYALATMYYGDIDPDFDDGFQNGVHPLFYDDQQQSPAADQWGSIGAWAWGLSRIYDMLTSELPEVDAERIGVMGHSRLGKTALWAGALDKRFAVVVSNNSGCGGAALSRRKYGETVARINSSFPHWFCDNFNQYNDNESALPFDQHMLIALMAPRPVLICSAEEDRWADPQGEFLSALHADGVFRLLGTDGLAAETMPELNRLIDSRIGYRIRPGRHDVLPSDWEAYLDFADHHFGRK